MSNYPECQYHWPQFAHLNAPISTSIKLLLGFKSHADYEAGNIAAVKVEVEAVANARGYRRTVYNSTWDLDLECEDHKSIWSLPWDECSRSRRLRGRGR